MVTKTLNKLGLVSIESQVSTGVKKVEGLIQTIKDTKADLLGLVAGGIVEKDFAIRKLEEDKRNLVELQNAVRNLG